MELTIAARGIGKIVVWGDTPEEAYAIFVRWMKVRDREEGRVSLWNPAEVREKIAVAFANKALVS